MKSSILRMIFCGVAMLVAVLSPLLGQAAVQDLTVSNYQLISSQRVTRTEFNYTYRANVINASSVDILNVTATLTSKTAKTVVVQGALHFGDVPAGQTVTSSDMFTIRQDRSVPFNPADLVWAVSGQAKPATILVPNVVGLTQPNAQTALTSAQLLVGMITTANSVTIPTGSVISQSPAAGTMVPPGSAVDLVASLGPADTIPPVVTITAPGDGSVVNSSPITVTGTIDDPTATLTVNGTTVVVSGGTFTVQIPLAEGPNTITATATDPAGNVGQATITLTYVRVLTVTITAPANLSYFNISPTTVTGTVDDPTTTVTVNAIPAAVVNGNFSVAVPLAEGPNLVTASASTPAGVVGVASIQVTLDTPPPHVTITSPPDQFVTTDSAVTVAGIVNDIVVGTVNDQQAQVTVNGVTAQVANRTFLAADVPLVLGSNVIQAVGRDRVGNAATTQVTVTRQAPTQQARIQLLSGNNQAGVIGSVLPAPLVVALTDATGHPVPNKPVIVKVTQNDGMVAAGGPSAPSVIATTDVQGLAQVQWTLGMRAGAGANAVEAYAVGFVGTAMFTATGT